jgi:hypothetical protein
MSAGEFLTEFRLNEKGDTFDRHFKFSSPVTVVSVDPERVMVRERFTQAPSLFRHLDALAHAGAVVVSLKSRTWTIDACGLYAINAALRTSAVRKGGLNIVRHFLASRSHTGTPIGGDFDALLSFLEIRPVYTNNAALLKKPVIYYVSYLIGHKTLVKNGTANRRSHAKKA